MSVLQIRKICQCGRRSEPLNVAQRLKGEHSPLVPEYRTNRQSYEHCRQVYGLCRTRHGYAFFGFEFQISYCFCAASFSASSEQSRQPRERNRSCARSMYLRDSAGLVLSSRVASCAYVRPKFKLQHWLQIVCFGMVSELLNFLRLGTEIIRRGVGRCSGAQAQHLHNSQGRKCGIKSCSGRGIQRGNHAPLLRSKPHANQCKCSLVAQPSTYQQDQPGDAEPHTNGFSRWFEHRSILRWNFSNFQQYFVLKNRKCRHWLWGRG